MGRRLLSVALAFLCALAGCGGLSGQGTTEPTATVTAAPVPTDATETATSGSATFRANDVLRTHRAELRSTSFTVDLRIKWRFSNGSTAADTVVYRVGRLGRQVRATRENGLPHGDDSGYDLWFDGERAVVRTTDRRNETEFRTFEGDDLVEFPRWQLIAPLLYGFEPHRVDRSADGPTDVAGSIDDLAPSLGLEPREETTDEMFVRIDRSGYVERVVVTSRAEYDDQRVDARLRIDYGDVGSTDVSEPAWVENATAGGATATDGRETPTGDDAAATPNGTEARRSPSG